MDDQDKLRSRMEPYNNIAVVATLLAGFALTIFPSGVDGDLEDDDFPWGITGHILYNVLMGISFSINLVITVMLTLQLYFTQRLVVRHSATIAMRYLDRSENIRRTSIALFYVMSIPTFILAFTILLFAALHRVAAIITSVVIISGLIAVLFSIHSFYNFYGQTLQGLPSFNAQQFEGGVCISRSSSVLHKSSDTSFRPKVMDGPVTRGRITEFNHGAKTGDY